MSNDMIMRACVEMARTAGDFLKRFRDEGSLRVEEKGSDLDFVTNADKSSQDMIFGKIRELFPSHALIGEEDGLSDDEIAALLKKPGQYYWVVDPLDGTLNYIRGFGSYSVSIGVVRDARPIIGVVYCPVENELFTAELGKGAFLNGSAIRSSSCERLHNALVIPSVPPYMDMRDKMIDINARVSRVTLNTRTFGSAAREISHVAQGGADAYFEHGIHPWDVAAGVVIASEAGAVVSNLCGGNYELWNRGIIVSTKGIHEDLVKAIDFNRQ